MSLISFLDLAMSSFFSSFNSESKPSCTVQCPHIHRGSKCSCCSRVCPWSALGNVHPQLGLVKRFVDREETEQANLHQNFDFAGSAPSTLHKFGFVGSAPATLHKFWLCGLCSGNSSQKLALRALLRQLFIKFGFACSAPENLHKNWLCGICSGNSS